MASPHSSLLLDPLSCQEDHYWEEEDHYRPGQEEKSQEQLISPLSISQLSQNGLVLEEEEEELLSLLSKESDTHSRLPPGYPEADPFLSWTRNEAVGWIARASSHHGFTPQTAILAADYLDRFLSAMLPHGERRRWMAQLSSVACLSLAAKVEETHVPLLVNLQVEETSYVFESKTIKRMELLVLSTLRWKMYPVTPLSFTYYILRRMGGDENRDQKLVNNTRQILLHWEFQRRCQAILLTLIADSRWVRYLPSELAAATLLVAVGQLEPFIAPSSSEFENHLLALLNITKDKAQECCQFILESMGGGQGQVDRNKRKFPFNYSPPSPDAVIGSTFSCDSSNDSWAAAVVATSVSSSPEPQHKRPYFLSRSGIEGEANLPCIPAASGGLGL